MLTWMSYLVQMFHVLKVNFMEEFKKGVKVRLLGFMPELG